MYNTTSNTATIIAQNSDFVNLLSDCGLENAKINIRWTNENGYPTYSNDSRFYSPRYIDYGTSIAIIIPSKNENDTVINISKPSAAETKKTYTRDQLVMGSAKNNGYKPFTFITEPKAEKTKPHTEKNDYTNLLRAVEREFITDDFSNNYLYQLGCAVANGVLNKCISVSGEKMLYNIKKSVTADYKSIESINRNMDNAYALKWHDKTETLETTVCDKNASKAVNESITQSLGDGLDVAHAAVQAIKEVMKKAKNDGMLEIGYLEKPYTVRRLKQKVWLKIEESVNGWETVETTPISEIYKTVRRYIGGNASVNSASFKHLYIKAESTDSESGEQTEIYRRLGKYADLGSYESDSNGKPTAYTADESIIDEIDEILKKLNLTARQAEVLRLRMYGKEIFGKKAIATCLGVSTTSVKETLQQIQKKAVKCGMDKSKLKPEKKSEPIDKVEYYPTITPVKNHWEAMENLHKKKREE